MPLHKGKSEKVFKENVKEMMNSGHPQKQSLAAAYAVKRRAARHKMADGGPIQDPDKIKQFQENSIFNPSGKPIKKAEGGRIEAPKPEGAMRHHDEMDPEMERGMPGKPVALPDQEDLMHQEMSSSEMGRGIPSKLHLSGMEDDLERHGMSDSEMGRFASGGMIGMSDSEFGAGQPGRVFEGEDEEDEMRHNMSSSEMGRGLPGKIHLSGMEDDLERHGMSDSEMGRFAHGGMAGQMKGNAKLQQAYKSAHESVMSKHKSKMYADGGHVEIELNGMEEGEDSLGSSPLDKMDRHAAQKENYDEGMNSAFGDDGQDEMHGDSISERVRKKRMMG
jgi:hypothetical protein